MDDLISRSHLLKKCEKLLADAYERLKGVAWDSSLRTTLIIEKDERDRLCEMIRSEPEAIKTGARQPHFQTWCNSDGEPVVTHRVGWECPFCGDPDVKNFCPNCGARILPEGATEGPARKPKRPLSLWTLAEIEAFCPNEGRARDVMVCERCKFNRICCLKADEWGVDEWCLAEATRGETDED